jgi:hypothetical protein
VAPDAPLGAGILESGPVRFSLDNVADGLGPGG